MLNVIIFGGPGSGKGTQSEQIIEKYNLFHISTGELLRREIKEQTEIGRQAEAIIAKGQFVSNELITDLLSNVLDTCSKEYNGVIFDGYPRNLAQASLLDTLLAERGRKISLVVGLEVEEEELVTRLLDRGLKSGRCDDNKETIAKRIEVYREQTDPLRDFYIGEGKYVAINGAGDIARIAADINAAIDAVR